METFTIIPDVNHVQQLIAIASGFSNPLDLVREAISNSYDAKSTVIGMSFDVVKKDGEDTLRIILKDNGSGIEREHLKNFFDLGNSTRRGDKNTIGEKGHGTKVYFNSKRIELKTSTGETGFVAVLEEPFKTLHDGQIPEVQVSESHDIDKGTEIIIEGYNGNRRGEFNHENVKDRIMWFTKHGSVEKQFSEPKTEVKLFLKGLGMDEPEEIEQGHCFPPETEDAGKLFDKYLADAPDNYSKKKIEQGSLKNFPEIKYQAVFSLEGKSVKYKYNKMVRRRGHSAPEGSYAIRDRYGLWLCKDYIPIQRVNEWITTKGNEFARFHAFINCQGLKLTPNRDSVYNTPPEILKDLEEEVKKIYTDINTGDSWNELNGLENDSEGYKKIQTEEDRFNRRIGKINKTNVAKHKGITLVEPERESGVYSIFLLLSQVEKDLFPFQILDYDTYEGIDVIARAAGDVLIKDAQLYYVEFKMNLDKEFNHSFKNLHSIVCWDTKIKQGEIVQDVREEKRKMDIQARNPDEENDYTHYYLDNPKGSHKIEVFCLKDYLKERLSLEFRPRTSDAIV